MLHVKKVYRRLPASSPIFRFDFPAVILPIGRRIVALCQFRRHIAVMRGQLYVVFHRALVSGEQSRGMRFVILGLPTIEVAFSSKC